MKTRALYHIGWPRNELVGHLEQTGHYLVKLRSFEAAKQTKFDRKWRQNLWPTVGDWQTLKPPKNLVWMGTNDKNYFPNRRARCSPATVIYSEYCRLMHWPLKQRNQMIGKLSDLGWSYLAWRNGVTWHEDDKLKMKTKLRNWWK